MNKVKENPVGLDALIHDVQTQVYSLATTWNIDLTGYPRCYILEHNGKKTIESYLGDSEYSRSLIFSEENKFFFLNPEDVEKVGSNLYKTQIELYFIVNLEECKPNVTHRADEEVRNDVLSELSKLPNVKIVKVVHNNDRVFARFNNRVSQNYEYEYTDDMQPYHYFKVILETMPYQLTQTTCN